MLQTFESSGSNVIVPSYHRQDINIGIVHIGVGNFHRAHQQYYTNLLLNDADQHHWGICGVALLPGDEKLVRNLKNQKGEYTLTVCGRDGRNQVHQINSLVEVLWAMEDSEAILEKIAAAETKIITLTITEGGYNLDNLTGEFQIDDLAVAADIKSVNAPKTVFGYVAEGLRRRMHSGVGGITILSCDNLQHNGDTARRAFTQFFEEQDKELSVWVKENVTFPNSMVDRITPATRVEDIVRLNEKNAMDDLVPVYCEDFIQWVVEDHFAAGRPAWERVGVEFTDDVTSFEHMKLSLLNASHSLLSYPAFLSGFRKVDEAMHDPEIHRFVQSFMDKDITPYVPAPPNTDLSAYKTILLERFANSTVSDQVSRLCFDGMSKFPIYLMPNLIKMLSGENDFSRIAFGLASYRHYLKYKKDDNGEAYDIAEPWLTVNDLPFIESEDPLQFLQFKPFSGARLANNKKFADQFVHYCESIKEHGVYAVLKSMN